MLKILVKKYKLRVLLVVIIILIFCCLGTVLQIKQKDAACSVREMNQNPTDSNKYTSESNRFTADPSQSGAKPSLKNAEIGSNNSVTNNQQKEQNKDDKQIKEKILKLAYKGERLGFSDQIDGKIMKQCVSGDRLFMVTEKNSDKIYSCKTDGTDLMEIGLENSSLFFTLHAICSSFDNHLYILCSESHSSLYTDAWFIKVLNQDGEQENEIRLSGLPNIEYDWNTISVDHKNNIILLSEQLLCVLEPSGEPSFFLDTDIFLSDIAYTEDGTILVLVGGMDPQVLVLDIENRSYGQGITFDHLDHGAFPHYNIKNGDADFDFYCYTGTCIYGCDIGTGTYQKVVNFHYSSIKPFSIIDWNWTKDKKLVTLYYDGYYEKLDGIYTFRKMEPQDIASKSIVTCAGTTVSEQLQNQIMVFNQNQDKYYVVVEENEDNNILFEQCKPDIIDLKYQSYGQYISKNMLVDLNQYLNMDTEVNRKDLIDNIKQAMEVDGKLYHISPTFKVKFMIGNTRFTRERTSITLDDLKDMEHASGVKAFYKNDEYEVLKKLVSANFTELIDWNKKQCNFNNNDYIKILEYSKQYMSDPDHSGNGYVEEDELCKSFQKEDMLFTDLECTGATDISDIKQKYGQNLRFYGYPSNRNTGSLMDLDLDLGMYTESENKDGAWEFLKSFLTKDYYDSREDCLEHKLSIRKDSMEEELKNINTDNANQFRNIIETVSQIDEMDDSEIHNIICSEAEEYFNGNKTAKEAALQTEISVMQYFKNM